MLKLPLLAALGLLAALLLSRPAEAAPHAAGVVGNGTSISCQQSVLVSKLAGGGLVTFNCGPAPVDITLTSRKTITLPTIIDGGGLITLDGVNSTGLFQVQPGASLELRHITLKRGLAITGGAIINLGWLTLTSSSLVSNTASAGGGAIYSDGGLLIQGSTFLNDRANNIGALGGAVHTLGTAVILSSSFSDSFSNTGGAVDNGGRLTVVGATFTDNQAGSGGALANDNLTPGAWLTVTASTFFSNSAILGGSGGALVNYAQATIGSSTFLSNSAETGGAIANGDAVTGSGLTVTASTFVSNTADAGSGVANFGHAAISGATLRANSAGAQSAALLNSLPGYLDLGHSSLSGNLGAGIANTGTLTVTATTVDGNLADGLKNAGVATIANSTFSGNHGAGLVSGGSANLVNSTFAGNQGGGVANTNIFLLAIHNTLLAGNTPDNCSGSILSLGHNLDDGHSCGLNAAGDKTAANPLLLPLANNGGPTLTRALLPGSPAIGAGDNLGCPATDQRGVPRIGNCDIGAFESVYRQFLALLIK